MARCRNIIEVIEKLFAAVGSHSSLWVLDTTDEMSHIGRMWLDCDILLLLNHVGFICLVNKIVEFVFINVTAVGDEGPP